MYICSKLKVNMATDKNTQSADNFNNYATLLH